MSNPTAGAAHGFASFQLHPDIMKGIENAGFITPRPIQAQTLPEALKGRDILGLAQTGTGKTAGFALPILEQIVRDPFPGPRALILAPTRELAAQIALEIRTLAQCTRVRGVTIYGGVGQRPQVASLRQRPDIIVACPGRLLDLMNQGYVKLGNVQTFVLDEADQMFDMGFLDSIKKIVAKLPNKRQNLLFSATMPKAIRHLADDMLNDPHVVELAHTKPIDLIEQVVYPVHRRLKVKLLEHLLENDDVSRAIIFTRTKRGAKVLAQKLDRGPKRALALQGNMSQSARDKAMSGFRAGRVEILVATDIAARGIDVAAVSHVINYDVPDTPEAYTHRIGRTGRAELTGKACTFITREDRSILRAIERRIKEDIPQLRIDEFIDCDEPEYERHGAKRGPGRQRNSRGQSEGRPARARTRQYESKTGSRAKSADESRGTGNSSKSPSARRPKSMDGKRMGNRGESQKGNSANVATKGQPRKPTKRSRVRRADSQQNVQANAPGGSQPPRRRAN